MVLYIITNKLLPLNNTEIQTPSNCKLSADKLGFIYPEIDPESPDMDVVCQFFNGADRKFKNSEVYMERIVKAVNMHDELLAFVKEFYEFNYNDREMLHKANKLIQQAEQK